MEKEHQEQTAKQPAGKSDSAFSCDAEVEKRSRRSAERVMKKEKGFAMGFAIALTNIETDTNTSSRSRQVGKVENLEYTRNLSVLARF